MTRLERQQYNKEYRTKTKAKEVRLSIVLPAEDYKVVKAYCDQHDIKIGRWLARKALTAIADSQIIKVEARN